MSVVPRKLLDVLLLGCASVACASAIGFLFSLLPEQFSFGTIGGTHFFVACRQGKLYVARQAVEQAPLPHLKVDLSHHGRFAITHPGGTLSSTQERWVIDRHFAGLGWRFANVGLVWGGSSFRFRWDTIAIPLWWVTIVTGAPLITWWLRRRRDRRRRRRGQCAECGYDLRHSPERCPECGTASPQVAGVSGTATRPSLHA